MTARRTSIGPARAGPNRRTRHTRSAATRARPSPRSCLQSSSSTPVTTRCPPPSSDLRGTSNVTNRLDYNKIDPNDAQALGGVYGHVVDSGLPAALEEFVSLPDPQVNNRA